MAVWTDAGERLTRLCAQCVCLPLELSKGNKLPDPSTWLAAHCRLCTSRIAAPGSTTAATQASSSNWFASTQTSSSGFQASQHLLPDCNCLPPFLVSICLNRQLCEMLAAQGGAVPCFSTHYAI